MHENAVIHNDPPNLDDPDYTDSHKEGSRERKNVLQCAIDAAKSSVYTHYTTIDTSLNLLTG